MELGGALRRPRFIRQKVPIYVLGYTSTFYNRTPNLINFRFDFGGDIDCVIVLNPVNNQFAEVAKPERAVDHEKHIIGTREITQFIIEKFDVLLVNVLYSLDEKPCDSCGRESCCLRTPCEMNYPMHDVLLLQNRDASICYNLPAVLRRT